MSSDAGVGRLPAGFREGVGVGLFTPDGRYLGLMGLVPLRTAEP
jgi:hypothetical protein